MARGDEVDRPGSNISSPPAVPHHFSRSHSFANLPNDLYWGQDRQPEDALTPTQHEQTQITQERVDLTSPTPATPMIAEPKTKEADRSRQV